MGRERGRGPDRGPRKRRRGKIAGTEAEEAVRACLLGGGTLEEASRLVRDIQGKNVSKDSVSRYYHRLLEAAERAQMLEAFARAMGEKLASRGATGARMARKMLLARALEAAASLTPEAMESLTPDRLALLLCRLERAEAEADRHRWEAGEREDADEDPRERDPAVAAAGPLSLAERLEDLLGGLGGPADAPEGAVEEPEGAREEGEAGAP